MQCLCLYVDDVDMWNCSQDIEALMSANLTDVDSHMHTERSNVSNNSLDCNNLKSPPRSRANTKGKCYYYFLCFSFIEKVENFT